MAIQQVTVPDIGGDEAEVIEILVKPGDQVAIDDGLVSLESDKATMDVPAPFAGLVKEIKIKVGDKVTEGSVVVTMEAEGVADSNTQATPAPEKQTAEPEKPATQATPAATTAAPDATAVDSSQYGLGTDVHASPAVRRAAREFGVELRRVPATGDKGRITLEDVQNFVKNALAAGGGSGLNLIPPPSVDFTKFGEIETVELNKIKKLTAKNLHRNWVSIPHVTQFDEADITELETFRKEQKQFAEQQGLRLTPLIFIMKAVVAALKEYPQFNSSLSNDGESLILKKYFHIGIAVDTPNGLVVPVIRDVDRKGMFDLAKDLMDVSEKARNKQLKPQDMQGACFSISSLGGISGTAFTPIINMPEVAILGVSRSKMEPVYHNGEFVPRLKLPLSLSYDHRVIDGAEAARFTAFLSRCLSDIRRLLL